MIEDLWYSCGPVQQPGSFPHVPVATDGNSVYLAYDVRAPRGGTFALCIVDPGDYPFADDAVDLYVRGDSLADLLDQLDGGSFATF